MFDHLIEALCLRIDKAQEGLAAQLGELERREAQEEVEEVPFEVAEPQR